MPMTPERQWVLEQFSLTIPRSIRRQMKSDHRRKWTGGNTSAFAAAVMLQRHVTALQQDGMMTRAAGHPGMWIRLK